MTTRHPSEALTPQQHAFLERLHEFIVARGYPPTVREMQELGGFSSPRSVTQYIDALEARGYVERLRGEKRTARNLRVLRQPDGGDDSGGVRTQKVPLLGHVPAGSPVMAEEHVQDWVPVSTDLLRPGAAHFLLHVTGDSMDLAGLHDGDLILVRQQATAQDGDIVVALVDGDVTLKRLRLGFGAATLQPESSNPRHAPVVTRLSLSVQGVVVGSVPVSTGRAPSTSAGHIPPSPRGRGR